MSVDQTSESLPDRPSFPGLMRLVEDTIGQLSDSEKLALIGRIARTIPSERPADDERGRRQHESRLRLLAEMESWPTASNDDGFSNRDHDKVLYGTPS